ncbi:unnamed protein product [Allacma fusca]|uniref:Uncharacterized protein n=1 Tax=Allacma fusca TaxID=39272 RepID=A0A8J2JTY3_9HEXA|nr:unnamed protein product [Allacma fusca]
MERLSGIFILIKFVLYFSLTTGIQLIHFMSPLKNCTIVYYTIEDPTKEEINFKEILLHEMFVHVIPLIQTHNSFRNRIVDLNQPCKINFKDATRIFKETSEEQKLDVIKYRILKAREILIYIVISTQTLTMDQVNILPAWLQNKHDNILTANVVQSASQNYEVVQLFRYQWFCPETQVCVEEMELLPDAIKNGDPRWFFQTFSQSFVARKNFNSWPVSLVSIFQGKNKIWKLLPRKGLRYMWAMSSSLVDVSSTGSPRIKFLAEMTKRFNFTPRQILLRVGDLLPSEIAAYAGIVEITEPSVLLITVSWEGLNFLDCSCFRNSHINMLQILTVFDGPTIGLILITVVITVFLTRKYGNQSVYARALSMFAALLNQVHLERPTHNLLILWTFAALLISIMYSSIYESVLVHPEDDSPRSFKALAERNYRLLIDDPWVHWLFNDETVSDFKNGSYLRKLRETAITKTNFSNRDAVIGYISNNRKFVWCHLSQILEAAAKVFTWKRRSGRCQCRIGYQLLYIKNIYWRFDRSLARIFYDYVNRLVSSGFTAIYDEYESVYLRLANEREYLRELDVSQFEDYLHWEVPIEPFIFSLKSTEALSVLMIFVVCVVSCLILLIYEIWKDLGRNLIC